MTEPIDIAISRKLRPLMPKFLAVRSEELAKMKAALAAGDIASLERHGHTLYGTASSYGFSRLGEIGKGIEAAAQAGEATALARLVAELEDHLARARIRYV
ncbi:MAG: Hpt domain-containing protein [Gammaproteobacteria bacterium]|nr:Hpt domain-containing protein [Gammaproteobacteria bacterium]